MELPLPFLLPSPQWKSSCPLSPLFKSSISPWTMWPLQSGYPSSKIRMVLPTYSFNKFHSWTFPLPLMLLYHPLTSALINSWGYWGQWHTDPPTPPQTQTWKLDCSTLPKFAQYLSPPLALTFPHLPIPPIIRLHVGSLKYCINIVLDKELSPYWYQAVLCWRERYYFI